MAYSVARAAQASGSEYEVFLNFRGFDTRHGFADFLYYCLVDAGVRVFRDDEELRVGEVIGGSLLHAINNSIIYVSIFSRTYASSKWCFREFAHIIDNVSKSKGQKSILPIFLGVEPEDVKLKTPLYSDALLEHAKQSPDEAEHWRKALQEVDQFEGWIVKKDQSQAVIVKSVVKEVLEKLEIKQKSMTEPLVGLHDRRMEKMKDEAGQRAADVETSDRNYAIAAVQNVVGIDDRAKHITDLLEMEVSDEVRIVGIYGTDGIGKTTLAKAVYDSISYCFDRCSFLAEVEETIQNPRGIQFLQTKLIRDILKQDREDPSFDEEDFLDAFRKMKVLIVVDGVEEKSHLHAIVGDQLHWFGPGSRIIVTSKNSGILEGYDPEKACNYMVSELDDGQAFELFCKHAFRMQSSKPDYDGVSNRIVNATEKLPLAVEVVGSFLRGKSIQEWLKMEESMQARTMSSQKTTVGLEEILDICYQELDKQQKDIFLEIACFISGVDARGASYMWPNCYLPSSDCILMPLAKIGENNELRMHRLLRCLGKRVLNQKGSGDPIGRKFYIQDMVPKAISREKGTETVEAHCFDFTAGDFQSMPEIRFLKLYNAKLSGNFKGAFASLRWLCWQRCPLEFDAFNFVLGELVILDLSWSKVTEAWGGWRKIEMKKLKVLNLTGCSDLRITPDFSGYRDLEILILERCSRLVELHPSIGHLKRLVSLNLKSCSRLHWLSVEEGRLTALSKLSLDGSEIKKLPRSLGELLNLRRLSLRNCHYMEELPDSIGEMGLLEELDISATRISRLPDSVRNLKVLNLTGCFNLRITPDFSGYKDLEILILERCYRLKEPHPSIGHLKRLVSLNLKCCFQLNRLPGEVGCLTALSELSLDGAKITKLPRSVRELLNLRRLSLRDCHSLVRLPDSIGEMASLEELDISTTRISELPNSIRNLKSLRVLRMDSSFIREFPKEIGNLTKLEELHASWCRDLEGAIPGDIGGLRHLRSLTLGHSSISSLPLEISTIPVLRTLDLIQCNFIEELPKLPPSLIRLRVSSTRMKAILHLEDLTKLEELCLGDGDPKARLPPSVIEEIEGLEGLKALKMLDISNCRIRNLNWIGQLTSLRSLILSDCDYLHSLPDLSKLKSLKLLEIRRCKMIHQIEGLQNLTALESLNIGECPAENSVEVENALKLVRARSVKIWGGGDFIRQGATSSKRDYREEILPYTSNKRMEKMKDEAGQRAADVETSDRKYAIAAVQNVVGIDDRAKHITNLLEMEVNDEVRIVGIYGTDGIGKTTLAKAVYDQISFRFDCHSFLAEVKETTQNPQFLQTKLIRNILRRDREDPSFDERIEDFLDIFCEMKVLIVVDDVEEPSYLHAIIGDQLHWFGPGSRIIVTSQNEEILKGYDPEKARTCTVSELDDGQAFELFCKHAFRMQSSIPDYDGLANRIVNATVKLPLAVEVVGSFLRGKSIQEWLKMEESMKLFTMSSQKTTVGLEEILDICYEALDPKQKDIFLEIAGFISGVDARIASYVWPNFPSSGCILMPLAKVGENNELQMHRLLRCLGKRILNQVGSGDPIGRKFYIQDMVPKAISREKGTENAKAHCFDFTAGDFQSMPEIRFLKLDNAKLSGNFKGAFASLEWLCWQRCPLEFDAFNFVLGELVILDLSWSKVTEDWGGWKKIEMKKLKVLNLTGCSDLRITPDFSGYKDLEILILERCSRLVELHPSIGHLNHLVSLNLKSCSELNRLPGEVGRLTALSELSLDGTEIFELPSSMGELLNLRRLSLRDCHSLVRLPDSIGEMELLEELDISATFISRLSDSIRNLKSLRVLRMDSSFIREFPREIGNLTKLEELHASWCWSLEGAIPGDIGGLGHLRSLTLRHSHISSLPPKISASPGLRTLDLIKCDGIEELPKLPPSLICLRVSSTRMKAILHLEDLTELEELCLSDGDPKARRPPSAIEEIEGLEGLKALKRLDISNCKIRNLNGIGQLTLLRSLILSDCDYLHSLPDLSKLKSLKLFEIRRCKMIHQIEGLQNLTALESLNIGECPAENSVEVENALKLVRARSVKIWGGGDFIRQGATSSKRDYREEILPYTSNKSMEKMEDEDGQQAADMVTSDRNYAIAAVQNIDGIDDRVVKQITDLLEMEDNDEVRIIGIYGTDGIGKTTLAKAVYKRISSCFDSCSFLAEVDETKQNHPRGIEFLQTKLMRDILKRDREDPSLDERIKDFLDIFREMKVLIVVDDVENTSDLHAIVGDQFHWFGPGSRIIVTSPSKTILEENDLARTYMVGKLDDGKAFELFRKHAFGEQSSPPGYDGHVNCIVNATDKLPLAVEVVGSFLRGKSIQEWLKMEESMEARTMSSQKTTVGLREILDICYQELDEQKKDIFLDIAGFVSGVDARIASYMWPNCYLPSSDCFLMPLAKIGENNELQMHRLLRCLGKEILEQEESQDPSSRRFCTQDMVLKAMNREKGMENVEALCFDFTAGHFRSMPKIRFLKLNDAKVSGDFKDAFPSLRWLCWQGCPLEFHATNFELRELVFLELSWSKITEGWGGWRRIKMEKLKVLNLTGCSDLLITPNFSGYKYLEVLILERCSRLVKLDPSIGHLKCLVSLNLKFCSRLNWLPVEVGSMTALKELFIDGTSVREIPISIGNLKHLEILSGFKCFPLTHLPSSICYLTALSELSLDGAKITELPSSLGELLKLTRLSLRDCRYMRKLPDSIGKMGSSLKELDISGTSISKLPNSIRNLQSLTVLRMDSSFIQAFPREIGNLTKLEELHASWCRSLEGAIPRDIKRLHHLRSLTLEHSNISSLPSEISTITSLQTLDLLQCNEIEVLPELPPSLIRLRVSSKRMKAIPLLKDLKELEELYLSDEDLMECRSHSEQPMPESNVLQSLSIWFSRLWNLDLLQTQKIDKQSFLISFPKLKKLELSLSQIIRLKFELTDIPQLKKLNLSALSLKEVFELPKTLSVFKLYHSAIEEIKGLEGLKALRRLDISNCNIKNLNGIGQLTSLRSLILSDCDDLSSLDLSNLKSLKVLEIRRCKKIEQIEGLEKLASLVKLNISECPAEKKEQVQNALKDVRARSTVT